METINLETLFHRLLHYRDETTNSASLGPWLQSQLKAGIFPDLAYIPFAEDTYTRNCIAREETAASHARSSQFEALIMRWDKQVRTCIHGHPAFSFYYVVSGVFEIDLFAQAAGSLKLQQTQRFSPSDTTWFSGQPGRYDNWIHRVRCLEPGLTFHVYSDDAKKGIVL